jgi:tetratricopeptide (TPR) repeat protein
MKDESPSIQEWKDLYSAALDFKKLQPWEWMDDSDMFCVQNPATGEIGYCCVLGKASDFALGVYPGDECLLSRMLGEPEPSELNDLNNPKCLMASFFNEGYMDIHDYETIKRLELGFDRHQPWPVLRSHLPGYVPWYLNRDEAQFLTLTLQQAIIVCKHFKSNPKKLISPASGKMLIRVSEEVEDGLKWRDDWLDVFNIEESGEVLDDSDVEILDDLADMKRQGTWEVDAFYLPEPVQEEAGERPFYPYVITWAVKDGEILNGTVSRPDEKKSAFLAQLRENTFSKQNLPHEISIKRDELLSVLTPITNHLEIELTRVDSLEVLENAEEDCIREVMEEPMDYLEEKIDKIDIEGINPPKVEYADQKQTTPLDFENSNKREFVDRDHEVSEDYYKLMGKSLGKAKLKKRLKKLIRKDPEFFDSYISLSQMLYEEDKKTEADLVLDNGYKRAIKIITTEENEWPDLLEWGWVKNRHVIRIIMNKAISSWNKRETDPALDLFRKLLKSNPSDNIGARNYILAIRMHMSFDEFEEKFNKDGFYDSSLIDWFDDNYKKFPDEFDWWDKATEEYR